MKKNILVILDRDGVINHDSSHYIKSADEWRPMPHTLEAIASLNHANILVGIATNQRGIALGLLDHNDLNAMHAKMNRLLATHHGWIDRLEYCTADNNTHPDRKPNSGMLHKIMAHFQFTPENATIYFVGDKVSDLDAGLSAKINPILVKTGNGEKSAEKIRDNPRYANIPIYDDLAHFTQALLQTLGE